MKRFKHVLTSSLLTIILFSLAVATETANAQQVNKVFDEIGGGGGSSNSTEDSGSGNTMFIVGGVLVAGVLLYALLRDKKEPEKKDSTAVISNPDFLAQRLADEQKLSAEQTQIPVNIFIGSHADKVFREDKRYFVGVSLSF